MCHYYNNTVDAFNEETYMYNVWHYSGWGLYMYVRDRYSYINWWHVYTTCIVAITHKYTTQLSRPNPPPITTLVPCHLKFVRLNDDFFMALKVFCTLCTI